MASQQVLFSETIAGMKKALKRKAYESDSDSEIEHYGNRGHKLKKRARFANKGQLVPSAGPGAYKEPVDYAGVRRSILYRNPPLIDEDGYEVDSDDDDDRIEDAVIAAAELNPYSNIRIENIFAPLTASTDLPTHPTLSKPFTSTTLTNLVGQSSAIMRKENQSLWQVRHLWTSLCGDGTWMPCEAMVRPNDAELYSDDHVARHLLSLSKVGDPEASSPGTINGEHRDEHAGDRERNGPAEAAGGAPEDADVSMADHAPAGKDGDTSRDKKEEVNEAGSRGSIRERPAENGRSSKGTDDQPKTDGEKTSKQAGPSADSEGPGPARDNQPTNGTRTENERNEDQDIPTTSEASQQAFIHPVFLPPVGAKPDRDLGLPEQEAEDIRRLLALYVQKQEEVCRGATRLQQGLMKAERLRNDVLHWAKAEAHSGANRDMSDGEDWYDKEEWGLTEDLKKGQDEEEEDTTTTGKKTRNRRQ